MYYGFDIGGTKIALGVFDSTRRLQWEKRVPTPHTSYTGSRLLVRAISPASLVICVCRLTR